MLHSGLRGEITETVILVGSFSPGSVVILPNPLALHQLRPKPRRLVNATFGLHLERRMFRQQYVRRARLVLLLLATGVMGCQRNQPPLPPSSPSSTEGTQSREDAFWVSGWTYYLRPIKSGAPTDADKGKEVWRDLFPGMAKDAKTRELLTRLHGGWPTELVVIDAEHTKDQAAFKAMPPEGVAVVLRVADLNRKDVKTNAGPVPFREITYGRVIRIKDAVIAELPLGKKEPLPEEGLSLAIEDYVLRHAPGWVGRWGTGPGTSFDDDQRLGHSADEAKLPVGVEDQRRELDQKIKNYTDNAVAYYGAPRK